MSVKYVHLIHEHSSCRKFEDGVYKASKNMTTPLITVGTILNGGNLQSVMFIYESDGISDDAMAVLLEFFADQTALHVEYRGWEYCLEELMNADMLELFPSDEDDVGEYRLKLD